MNQCACGAFKVYKSPVNGFLHSDWCPWSPVFVVKRCSNMVTVDNAYSYTDNRPCTKPADRWVEYSKAGPRYYYCNNCWTDVSFSSGAIFDWGKC